MASDTIVLSRREVGEIGAAPPKGIGWGGGKVRPGSAMPTEGVGGAREVEEGGIEINNGYKSPVTRKLRIESQNQNMSTETRVPDMTENRDEVRLTAQTSAWPPN